MKIRSVTKSSDLRSRFFSGHVSWPHHPLMTFITTRAFYVRCARAWWARISVCWLLRVKSTLHAHHRLAVQRHLDIIDKTKSAPRLQRQILTQIPATSAAGLWVREADGKRREQAPGGAALVAYRKKITRRRRQFTIHDECVKDVATPMTGFVAFSSTSSGSAADWRTRGAGSAWRDCALNQTMFVRPSICLSVSRAKQAPQLQQWRHSCDSQLSFHAWCARRFVANSCRTVERQYSLSRNWRP